MKPQHIAILFLKILSLLLVLVLIPFSVLLKDNLASKIRFLMRDAELAKDEIIVRDKYGDDIVDHLLLTHSPPNIISCLRNAHHIWAYDGIHIMPAGNFRPDNAKELSDKKIYSQISALTAQAVQEFLIEKNVTTIHPITIAPSPDGRLPESHTFKNSFPLQFIVIGEYPDITLFYFLVKKTHNFAPTYDFSSTIKFRINASGKIPDISAEIKEKLPTLLPTTCPAPGIQLNCFVH